MRGAINELENVSNTYAKYRCTDGQQGKFSHATQKVTTTTNKQKQAPHPTPHQPLPQPPKRGRGGGRQEIFLLKRWGGKSKQKNNKQTNKQNQAGGKGSKKQKRNINNKTTPPLFTVLYDSVWPNKQTNCCTRTNAKTLITLRH